MKVLFCTDGSEESLAALGRAARLIRAEARACILYVVPEVDERFRHSERLHEAELQDIERLFGDQGPGVEVLARTREALQREGVEAERKVRTGDPAEEILAEIREGHYDLVIVGSCSRSVVERFLVGSVSRRVCEAAETSVLVVKPWGGEGEGSGGTRYG
jgi:nucleotide-binding universal stress UspA family protein